MKTIESVQEISFLLIEYSWNTNIQVKIVVVMCGIIGITKENQNVVIGKQIYDALSRLEYRGYDSVGIALVTPESIKVAKDKGSIKDVGTRLEFTSMQGHTALGHSRWATHGPPNQINAHPHESMSGRVVVVHNGIIENFMEIKNELLAEGYSFTSQTDTETIPHYLESMLLKGKTMEDAIFDLSRRIEGTFALVISHIDDPEKIYALRRDNPLVLGITEDAIYCASDVPAFLPWTKDTIILRDNELAILSPGKYELRHLVSGKTIKREPHRVTWTAEAAQKGGYPHYMLKEIHEQPTVLTTQLNAQDDTLERVGQIILNASKVIVVAAGTAHYASLTAYHTIPKFGGPLVLPCIAAEWDSVKYVVDKSTVILAVSQSGETLDTIKAVKDGIARGATLISVVNVQGSSITTVSDEVVYIHAGPEIGVAATKTFLAQSFAVWRISYYVAKLAAKLSYDDLEEFDIAIKNAPETVAKIIKRTEAQARDLASWFKSKNSAFYLGRGISHITVLEGALKMKEISYIHAEAYPAGESKHGPIALVADDYPVVFAIPQDETRAKMMGSVQEMAARSATTIGIIEEGDEEMMETLSHYFVIPKGYSKYLSTVVYQIPLQFLAYYTSVQKSLNPDRPKNLAKCLSQYTPVWLSNGEKIPIIELFEEYKNLGKEIEGEGHETIIELFKEHRLKVIGFDNEAYILTVTEATHLYKGISDILLKITTNSGRIIKITPIHKLQVFEDCIPVEKQARDINIGEQLLIPHEFSIDQNTLEIEFQINENQIETNAPMKSLMKNINTQSMKTLDELYDFSSKFFIDPIVDIEILEGPFDVYDLTVPWTKKFIAGKKSLIVHNSVTVE